MQILRQLATSFSPQRLEFKPRAVYVGLADKVAWVSFLTVTIVLPCLSSILNKSTGKTILPLLSMSVKSGFLLSGKTIYHVFLETRLGKYLDL
jgi:hypothetical protein